MDSVFITLSGTNLSSGLIVREVSFYFPSSDSRRHYFIDTQSGLKISAGDRKTDNYTRRFLGGMSLHTPLPGSLQPSEIKNMLLKVSLTHDIFCIGSVDQIFLESTLPYTCINDVQDLVGFKYPKTHPSQTVDFNTMGSG